MNSLFFQQFSFGVIGFSSKLSVWIILIIYSIIYGSSDKTINEFYWDFAPITTCVRNYVKMDHHGHTPTHPHALLNK